MADPNPQIRRGPGHPDPETRWRGGCLKFLFRAFGPQFGPKIREGGGGAWGAGPISGSATDSVEVASLARECHRFGYT